VPPGGSPPLLSRMTKAREKAYQMNENENSQDERYKRKQ
jgi:hypothetical protein